MLLEIENLTAQENAGTAGDSANAVHGRGEKRRTSGGHDSRNVQRRNHQHDQ